MNFELITTIFFVATAFVVVMGAIITFLDDKSEFMKWFYRCFRRISIILVLGTIMFNFLSYV